MTLSKEARIGLLVTAAVVIFFLGFYFLKGLDIFSAENEYYCYFDNVQGLQPSAPVQVRGMNVGRVTKTQLMDNKNVLVVITVSKKVEVTQGTTASLVPSDLITGAKSIRLNLGNGTAVIANKSTLPSNIEGGVVDNISNQVSPMLKDVRGAIAQLDSALVGISNIVSDQNQQAISKSLSSINATADNLATLSSRLSNEAGEINSIIAATNKVTTNLARNNDNINKMLTNTAAATDQLAKAPIEKTIKDLDETIAQLQVIMNKINNNQGSLGMMVNDKNLYTNLTNSLNTLNLLMADIKAHPSHYINVSIFGKKKQ